MRILILGGDGMLGHRLLTHLAQRHDARVTLRRPLREYERFGLFHRGNACPEVDVRDAAGIDRAVADFAPDAVVNAAGIVKQRADPRLDVTSMEVNAIAPHLVARVCRSRGARLVHLSTDCVFSGNKGNYSERDRPDPVDVYGLSKLLGEAGGPGVLTLRTSMIGPELDRKTGLVEWFLAQRNASRPVTGWRRAVFSGFTTAELARLIDMLLARYPAAAGLYHASSAAISKLNLLAGLERRLKLGIPIEPADQPVCDRSLDSTRFRVAFGYVPPLWDTMLDELAADLLEGLRVMFDGKRILVTGGTGSMGRAFVHRVLSGAVGKAKKVIVFSRDEAKQHEMRVSYLHRAAATDEVIYDNFRNVLEFRIGDVRDFGDVCSAVKAVDIVVNAAALKQVPTCEYFPTQAVLTNCFGAANIVRAIEEHGYPVETVVGISTDKACKPVNVMGMTKSVQERILIAANVLNARTRFICVRYGNVLASRGSVIPLFHEQIANGSPVTVTDQRMTRFLISLEDAVDTVLAALGGAKAGEIYVPQAPAVSVVNLARALVGKRRVKMKVTGIRPGEKLHEVLVSEEEIHHCVRRGAYYVVRPMLPELRGSRAREPNALKREYSSGDNVLGPAATVALLKRNRLLVEDQKAAGRPELLR